MASLYLEQLRATNEEVEIYERALMEILKDKPRGKMGQVIHDHKISHLLDGAHNSCLKVKELQDDADGMCRRERDELSGQNIFTQFYDRLKEIKEHYRRFGNDLMQGVEIKPPEDVDVHFSGEEQYGRFFDLYRIYEIFVNLPGVEAVDYFTYLVNLDRFDQISIKKGNVYKRYLQELFEYLVDFHKRIQPLENVNEELERAYVSFEQRWESGTVPGWEQVIQEAKNAQQKYCSACAKWFTNEAVYVNHLSGKKHQKNEQRMCTHQNGSRTVAPEALAQSSIESKKEIALLEDQISRMLELMHDVFDATKKIVEKKQTLTYEELQAEFHDEEGANAVQKIEEEEEEEEEDQPIYNPKNLPLGWDGKPIPYWLYKLHELDKEYKCEICGNYSYWGRRAFDRHFQEWRHAHGMKCLGIPNTKHFHDITSIEDALSLYQSIKHIVDRVEFKPEQEEEFEDAEGNVMSKKTFDDLKRQGLI